MPVEALSRNETDAAIEVIGVYNFETKKPYSDPQIKSRLQLGLSSDKVRLGILWILEFIGFGH